MLIPCLLYITNVFIRIAYHDSNVYKICMYISQYTQGTCTYDKNHSLQVHTISIFTCVITTILSSIVNMIPYSQKFSMEVIFENFEKPGDF